MVLSHAPLSQLAPPNFTSEAVCPGRNRGQRHGGPYQAAPDALHPRLLISGPIHDGFWVRVAHVLVLHRWASLSFEKPVPVRVQYNSANDSYYDAATMGAANGGWDHYFEPIDESPTEAPTFELPCALYWRLLHAPRRASR